MGCRVHSSASFSPNSPMNRVGASATLWSSPPSKACAKSSQRPLRVPVTHLSSPALDMNQHQKQQSCARMRASRTTVARWLSSSTCSVVGRLSEKALRAGMGGLVGVGGVVGGGCCCCCGCRQTSTYVTNCVVGSNTVSTASTPEYCVPLQK
jgi:hypothetical protein